MCHIQIDVPVVTAAPLSCATNTQVLLLRVRGEIMGAGNCENVGESQSVLIVIDPMISPRTRSC
jgi:hypothetical protein